MAVAEEVNLSDNQNLIAPGEGLSRCGKRHYVETLTKDNSRCQEMGQRVVNINKRATFSGCSRFVTRHVIMLHCPELHKDADQYEAFMFAKNKVCIQHGIIFNSIYESELIVISRLSDLEIKY